MIHALKHVHLYDAIYVIINTNILAFSLDIGLMFKNINSMNSNLVRLMIIFKYEWMFDLHYRLILIRYNLISSGKTLNLVFLDHHVWPLHILVTKPLFLFLQGT